MNNEGLICIPLSLPLHIHPLAQITTEHIYNCNNSLAHTEVSSGVRISPKTCTVWFTQVSKPTLFTAQVRAATFWLVSTLRLVEETPLLLATPLPFT